MTCRAAAKHSTVLPSMTSSVSGGSLDLIRRRTGQQSCERSDTASPGRLARAEMKASRIDWPMGNLQRRGMARAPSSAIKGKVK